MNIRRDPITRPGELGPNPIQDASELGDYRSFVVSLFPRLRWCDGHPITEEDRSEADAFASSKAGEVARHRLRADERQRDEHGRKKALATPLAKATPARPSPAAATPAAPRLVSGSRVSRWRFCVSRAKSNENGK